MIKNRITESMANVVLRQMGAVEIRNISAFVNKVKFRLDEHTNVTYIYEVKENETIYLTRVRPYSLYLGDCADEQELVEKIERDYILFRIAHETPYFDKYLKILREMQNLTNVMEDLFMQKETAEADLDAIDQKLQELYARVNELSSNSDLDMEEERKRQERELLGFELPER